MYCALCRNLFWMATINPLPGGVKRGLCDKADYNVETYWGKSLLSTGVQIQSSLTSDVVYFVISGSRESSHSGQLLSLTPACHRLRACRPSRHRFWEGTNRFLARWMLRSCFFKITHLHVPHFDETFSEPFFAFNPTRLIVVCDLSEGCVCTMWFVAVCDVVRLGASHGKSWLFLFTLYLMWSGQF